ncbi:MAG: DUF1178 family protein [Paracoccaceae bacterium]
MIRYSLKCPANHSFESWFKSSDAFETLQKSALLSCPVCGASEITKAVMAPRIQSQSAPAPDREPPAQALLASPSKRVAEAMENLRREIEAHSEHVGDSFAREARAIHEGDAPARAIHGEAHPDEARQLLQDGVQVLPLPFIPRRKVN